MVPATAQLGARLEARENLLAGPGIHDRRVEFLRRLHLRRRQAVRRVRALAQRHCRIELALQRIVDDAVLHAVLRVAGIQRGLMQHHEFLLGNVAGRVFVRGLRARDQLQALGGPVIAGIAGDDAFKILGKTLRFHERLPASARAAHKIRKARRRAVERRDRGLALQGRLVHGPIAEIDQLLGMTHGKARRVSHVSRVGRRGGISLAQRVGQRGVLNEPVPAAIAHFLELAVPAGDRQPRLGLDVRIAGRSDGHRHAAERRKIGEVRPHVFRRLELPGGNHLRRSDGSVGQLERSQVCAGGRVHRARRARVDQRSRVDRRVRCSPDIRESAQQEPERHHRCHLHRITSNVGCS